MIKPETWYNIPDPVCQAITVITKDVRVIFEQLNDLASQLKQTLNHIRNKDKRYGMKIKEVFDYFEETQNQQTQFMEEGMKKVNENMNDIQLRFGKKISNFADETGKKLDNFSSMLSDDYMNES